MSFCRRRFTGTVVLRETVAPTEESFRLSRHCRHRIPRDAQWMRRVRGRSAARQAARSFARARTQRMPRVRRTLTQDDTCGRGSGRGVRGTSMGSGSHPMRLIAYIRSADTRRSVAAAAHAPPDRVLSFGALISRIASVASHPRTLLTDAQQVSDAPDSAHQPRYSASSKKRGYKP
jgi:hypothetical protein